MQQSVPQIERNSSIELFRILATFLVLIVHWNGWFVGGMPGITRDTLSVFRGGQAIIESLSACCVNCFLLISGFCGIRLKYQSIVKLYCVLLFVKLPLYLVNCFLTHDFNLADMLLRFECFTNAGYFIQGYLVLMLLSPMLNAFVDKYKNSLWKWVLGFVLIEGWFCCLHKDNLGVCEGYSAIHFALMYLVGRAVALNLHVLHRYSKYLWLFGYFVLSAIVCFLYLFHRDYAFYYSNPLLIASTVCLFLPFTYCQFVSKPINWIGKSTLAVYILQVSVPICPWLMSFDKQLLDANPYPIYLALSASCVLAFFVFGIVYDKVMTYPQKQLAKVINMGIDKFKTKFLK